MHFKESAPGSHASDCLYVRIQALPAAQKSLTLQPLKLYSSLIFQSKHLPSLGYYIVLLFMCLLSSYVLTFYWLIHKQKIQCVFLGVCL